MLKKLSVIMLCGSFEYLILKGSPNTLRTPDLNNTTINVII